MLHLKQVGLSEVDVLSSYRQCSVARNSRHLLPFEEVHVLLSPFLEPWLLRVPLQQRSAQQLILMRFLL